MNKLSALGVAAIVLATVLSVSTTGGFAAVEADRSAEIDVAADDSAYLGVDIEPDEANCTATVTIVNRFTHTLDDVTIEYRDENRTISDLEPGAEAEREVSLDETADQHTFEITATSDNVNVDLTRELGDVDC